MIQGRAPRSKGLVRAQKERQDRIGLAERLYRTDQKLAKSLETACLAWASYIDGDDPYLVVRTEHEYSAMIDVLLGLGLCQDQLDISYIGPSDTALYTFATRNFEVVHVTGTRFSRGPRRIPRTQIGIFVKQKAGSLIGDGRDVHRLFAMLACFIKGEQSGE